MEKIQHYEKKSRNESDLRECYPVDVDPEMIQAANRLPISTIFTSYPLLRTSAGTNQLMGTASSSENWIQDSILNFGSMVDSKSSTQAPILLRFNNFICFKKKLYTSSLRDCFPAHEGGPTISMLGQYVLIRSVVLNNDTRKIGTRPCNLSGSRAVQDGIEPMCLHHQISNSSMT